MKDRKEAVKAQFERRADFFDATSLTEVYAGGHGQVFYKREDIQTLYTKTAPAYLCGHVAKITTKARTSIYTVPARSADKTIVALEILKPTTKGSAAKVVVVDMDDDSPDKPAKVSLLDLGRECAIFVDKEFTDDVPPVLLEACTNFARQDVKVRNSSEATGAAVGQHNQGTDLLVLRHKASRLVRGGILDKLPQSNDTDTCMSEGAVKAFFKTKAGQDLLREEAKVQVSELLKPGKGKASSHIKKLIAEAVDQAVDLESITRHCAQAAQQAAQEAAQEAQRMALAEAAAAAKVGGKKADKNELLQYIRAIAEAEEVKPPDTGPKKRSSAARSPLTSDLGNGRRSKRAGNKGCSTIDDREDGANTATIAQLSQRLEDTVRQLAHLERLNQQSESGGTPVLPQPSVVNITNTANFQAGSIGLTQNGAMVAGGNQGMFAGFSMTLPPK